jgi:hypothetical protein
MKRALILVLVACGTGNADASTPDALPGAEMGPFRTLANTELKGTAPFVLQDSHAIYTDPAALDGGILYVVANGAIVRTRADDGRTFYGNGQIGKSPQVVLKADRPWEGGALAGPSAIRRGNEVLLFYSAAGGIGLARSADGLAFAKEPGPVLIGASPSVFTAQDGSGRMFYNDGVGVSEAASSDFVTWRFIEPVLRPSLQSGAFDALGASDPCVSTRITPAGRFHVRVLYTGRNEAGATAIGFAARYGDDGPLERNPVPAYTTGSAPAYAEPFLYVAQTNAIAGAVLLDTALTPPAAAPPTP